MLLLDRPVTSTPTEPDVARFLDPDERLLYPEGLQVEVAEKRAARFDAHRHLYRSAREHRRDLQYIAGRVSRNKYVGKCGAISRKRPGSDQRLPVQMMMGVDSDGNALGGFAGLGRCGYAGLCPVCGPKVRQVRAGEINDLVGPWMRAGGDAAVLTFTMQVRPGEHVADHRDAIRDGFAAWKRRLERRGLYDDLGWVGQILSWEFTVRLDLSGNAHIMALWLFTSPMAWGFLQDLPRTWVETMARRDRKASLDHGLHIEQVRIGELEALSSYMAKGAEGHWEMGEEMCRTDRKQARSGDAYAPFELLDLMRQSGDISYDSGPAKAWRAYEKAQANTCTARWSKGLREVLRRVKETGVIEGVTPTLFEDPEEVPEDAEAAPDVEVANTADVEGKPVVEFDSIAWWFIWSNRKDMLLLRVCEEVADDARRRGVEPDYIGAVQMAMRRWGAAPHEIDGVSAI